MRFYPLKVQNDIQTNLRTLGPNEAKVALSFREQGRSVVSASDVLSLVGKETTARKVISNLKRKGWLSPLKNGRYLFLPPEYGPENLGENNPLAIASSVLEPSYIGWWSAASFHGMTTQKPMVVTVASLRQAPARTVEDNEIRFVKVVPRKFFGFETYDVFGRKAVISNPEKTVMDCFDRPDLAGGLAEITRIIYGASSLIAPEKLVDVALKMKSTAALQRLGFLADLIEWKWPIDVRQRLLDAIPFSVRSVMGRETRKEGDIGYVGAWRLIVHASKQALLADVPHHSKTLS